MVKGQLDVSKSVTPTEAIITLDSKKLDAQERLAKLVKEETRLVKGRFRCFETPGSRTTITCKKYKDVPMFKKEMVDGEIYEIPLYVARFLNGQDAVARDRNGDTGTCSYPVHGFKWNPGDPMPQSALGMGSNGELGIPVPLVGVAKRVRRYGFESLEFGVL